MFSLNCKTDSGLKQQVQINHDEISLFRERLKNVLFSTSVPSYLPEFQNEVIRAIDYFKDTQKYWRSVKFSLSASTKVFPGFRSKASGDIVIAFICAFSEKNDVLCCEILNHPQFLKTYSEKYIGLFEELNIVSEIEKYQAINLI